MFSYVLRRVAEGIGVLLVVVLIAFLLFRYVGDPVTFMVGLDTSAQDRAKLREQLGLDRPAWAQFASFVGQAVRGEFGVSLRDGRPVSALLRERIPATVELAACASMLAFVVGIPLGMYTALRRRAVSSRLLLALSLLGVSLPTFLIGILLIMVFSVWLGWLPSYGRGEVVQIGAWSSGLLTHDGWRHILLPAATLAMVQLALVIRLVRVEFLEALHSDAIRFARARGLRARNIYFGHALKNALAPVLTVAGLQLGGVIAFAIVTETVFQWPGMGLLFIQSIQFADVPVMAAYLCVVALVFVTINFVVDVLYAVIDPRLRGSGGVK